MSNDSGRGGEREKILVEIISFGVSTNLGFCHVSINQVCETRIYGEHQMEAEEDLKFPRTLWEKKVTSYDNLMAIRKSRHSEDAPAFFVRLQLARSMSSCFLW